MTNKPMLSVDRELIELAVKAIEKHHSSVSWSIATELRALLDKPAETIPEKTVDAFSAWYSKNNYEDISRATVGLMAFKAGAAYAEPAAQNQGDKSCEFHSSPNECEQYSGNAPCSPVKSQGEPVAWRYQSSADGLWYLSSSESNAYAFRSNGLGGEVQPLYSEQIAPTTDHTQCEECKGWGYHENHHEGGGTECGECGGSGNSMVAVALDTSALLGLLVSEISVDDRGFYHLSGIHPNNFKRALEESGAKITSEVKSHKSPVAVVMPERMDPRDPYDSEANQWNACLDEVARLNGVKP